MFVKQILDQINRDPESDTPGCMIEMRLLWQNAANEQRQNSVPVNQLNGI